MMASQWHFIVAMCKLVCACFNGADAALSLVEMKGVTSVIENMQLDFSAVLERVSCRSFLSCCTFCHESRGCGGVAYTEDGGQCYLLSAQAAGCGYFNGACTNCIYKTMLPSQTALGRDCLDVLELGYAEDGVYSINPSCNAPFRAYCDMSGGGWTVFQRRVDDSVDFSRDWSDYVAGFGDVDGNFWAGLDHIHALSSYGSSQLFVSMEKFDGTSGYSHYGTFAVAGPASNYVLTVQNKLAATSDDGLIDSMEYNDQQRFYTRDNDDQYDCAAMFGGGWWYYGGCGLVNPNAEYYHEGEMTTCLYGIFWYGFTECSYMKKIQLKMRRV